MKAHNTELSSKRAENNNNHLILIALFPSLREYYKNKPNYKVLGLIYPSAMSERKLLNIVLITDVAKNLICCEKVRIYRFKGSEKSYRAAPCCDVSIPTEEGYFQIRGHNTIRDEEHYEPEC